MPNIGEGNGEGTWPQSAATPRLGSTWCVRGITSDEAPAVAGRLPEAVVVVVQYCQRAFLPYLPPLPLPGSPLPGPFAECGLSAG